MNESMIAKTWPSLQFSKQIFGKYGSSRGGDGWGRDKERMRRLIVVLKELGVGLMGGEKNFEGYYVPLDASSLEKRLDFFINWIVCSIISLFVIWLKDWLPYKRILSM